MDGWIHKYKNNLKDLRNEASLETKLLHEPSTTTSQQENKEMLMNEKNGAQYLIFN